MCMVSAAFVPHLTFLDISLQPVHEACKFPRTPCPLTLPAGGIGMDGGGGKEGEVTPVLSSWWCPTPLRWQQLCQLCPSPGSWLPLTQLEAWFLGDIGFPFASPAFGARAAPSSYQSLGVLTAPLLFLPPSTSELNALC